MRLFQQTPALDHEKVAVPLTRMTGVQERWPEVVVSTLLQQAPYLEGYELHPSFTAIDPAQGHAFGFIAVNTPTSQSLQQQAQGNGEVQYLRVPIIIRDWKLHPFDLFMRGNSVYPLTERRAVEALTSPHIFDSVGRPPPDAAISQDLYPPSYNGMSNRSGFGRQGVFKLASQEPLLTAAAVMIGVEETELKKLAAAMEDPTIAWHLQRHDCAGGVISRMMKAASVEAPVDTSPPQTNAVQILRLDDGGYLLKSASRESFQVYEKQVDPITAANVGGEQVYELEPGQALTFTVDEVDTTPPEKLASLDSYGPAILPTAQGDVQGSVMRVRSLDGDYYPGTCFYGDGGEYALGEKLAGYRIPGNSRVLTAPTHQLRGHGILVNPRTKEASLPLEIEFLSSTKEQAQIHVKLASGKAYLELIDGIQEPVKLSENRYAVPSHLVFRSISSNIEGSGEEKTAGPTIDVWCDDAENYTLRGYQLSEVDRSFYHGVKEAQAAFMLSVLGVPAVEATEKLAAARSSRKIQKIHGCASIRVGDMQEKMAHAEFEQLRKGSVSFLFKERPCMLKTALEIDDANSLDKTLSLNFLRPENIALYVSRLPEFEEAVTYLADLLLGVRVGMEQVSEDAVRHALFSLEEVTQGLRVLAQTSNG